MKSELDTLFLPLMDGSLHDDLQGKTLAFLNGRFHPILAKLGAETIHIQQVFKPFAQEIESSNYDLIPDPREVKEGHYDTALLLASKNQRESETLLARAAMALKQGGLLVMAADNKAGGTRLKKMLENLGFDNIAEHSKNKARVVWARRPDNLNDSYAQKWLDQDKDQQIAQGFISRPGLYGWDKIDKGSALLADTLPNDLKGKGADFGCGYGYLCRAALEKNRKIKALDYSDADFRALDICARNLADFEVQKRGLWLDLTAPHPELKGVYDWIVMNPPFHEGKKTDSDIGVSFINSASASLRKKGRLFMVANMHLPYEAALERYFYNFEMIAQAGGFKVFCAWK